MSKTRQKGTSFETEVVRFLQCMGLTEAERNVLNSPLGDIKNLPIVVECKNHRTMTLAEWVDQAAASGTRVGKMHAVVHKRRGKNVSKAYVTMELKDFAVMLKVFEENT